MTPRALSRSRLETTVADKLERRESVAAGEGACEAYQVRLHAAVELEQWICDMLEDSAENAHDSEVSALFIRHRQDTERRVANLQEAFGQFDRRPHTSPYPAIDVLKDADKTMAETGDALTDSVLLHLAADVELHEIRVYEGLIAEAGAMGRHDIVALLQRDLDATRGTLKHVENLRREIGGHRPGADGTSFSENLRGARP